MSFRVSFFWRVRTILGVGKTPFFSSLRLIFSVLGCKGLGFWEERERETEDSMAGKREEREKKMKQTRVRF